MRAPCRNVYRFRPLLGLALGFALNVGRGIAQDNAPRMVIGKDARSIAITATDKVTHEADLATVHIGYQIFGPDKDAAYAAGSRASNAIVDALHKAGVADKEIESESQQIQPTEPYLLEKSTPSDKAARAFTIRQSWTARVPAAEAARALDTAVKAGANQSGEIDWSLADPNAAQAEAASKALQRARTQAAAMASGLGVKLGSLLYASNEVNAAPVRPLMRAAAAPVAVEQKVIPLAIKARHIETSATVYAVFAIE